MFNKFTTIAIFLLFSSNINAAAGFFPNGLSLEYADSNSFIHYSAHTQLGVIPAELAIMKTKANHREYYLINSFADYYPLQMLKILANTYGIKIKKVNNLVHIIYTQGANTTVVTTVDIKEIAKIKETKAIRWNPMINNDSGKSDDYEYFNDLFDYH